MDERVYESRFRHVPCQELVPPLDQPLLKAIPGSQEGRIQALCGHMLYEAERIHTGNCAAGERVKVEDFTVVTVMLNGVLENPEEAEAEYRQSWDNFLHY